MTDKINLILLSTGVVTVSMGLYTLSPLIISYGAITLALIPAIKHYNKGINKYLFGSSKS